VILRHDRPDAAARVDESQWPGIVSFFGGDGGASLLAPAWLLTAAHTAANIPHRHTVEIAGRSHSVVEVRTHPSAKGSERMDLALVRVAPATEGVRPFDLYERSDEVGKRALLLGRGDFGNGRDGVLGVDHGLRCVTNRVESCDRRWLRLRFDPPPRCTSLEGVCGEGDSGGPALLPTRTGLRLAGVSSWQEHQGPLGTYGCVEHYTRISTCLEWIRDVIAG
jgi:hypothetical protein